MWSPKSEHSEHEMSVAESTRHVQMMLERESRGWGDHSLALERIARRYGLSKWTLEHLRKGRAKTVNAGIRDRIRNAYLDVCERHIRALQNEIAAEKAKGAADDLHGIEAETEALVARFMAAREASRGR